VTLLIVKTLNLFLGFFHGEQGLVAIGLAGLIVVIAVPLIFYVWVWHTKTSERTLTLIYAVTTAVLCGVCLLPHEDPVSIIHLTMFILAGILTLPWNIITLIVAGVVGHADIGDREFVITMLLGAGVNSLLIFYGAKRVRRWKA